MEHSMEHWMEDSMEDLMEDSIKQSKNSPSRTCACMAHEACVHARDRMRLRAYRRALRHVILERKPLVELARETVDQQVWSLFFLTSFTGAAGWTIWAHRARKGGQAAAHCALLHGSLQQPDRDLHWHDLAFLHHSCVWVPRGAGVRPKCTAWRAGMARTLDHRSLPRA